MTSQNTQILGRFASLFFRSPLRTAQHLTKSLLHQIASLGRNPERLGFSTDSQRAKALETVVDRILSNNQPLRTRPHGLPGPLVVSLTSYARRFARLPLTLRCLLAQTMRPDKVLLWISHEDRDSLSPAILELREAGLEIVFCEDMGPFTKIIPTLQTHPHHFIVTADDDIYYHPSWLEELVTTWGGKTSDIVAHRAHLIRLNQQGLPLPYRQWSFDDPATAHPSPLNFATGVGGVLYPPDTFNDNVLNVEAFRRLCIKADDVWLYWMAQLNGSVVRSTGFPRPLITWPDTQTSALYTDNVSQGNDKFIKAMIAAYGFPKPPSQTAS